MATHDREVSYPAGWQRPSTWVIAFGVGLGVFFGVLGGHVKSDTEPVRAVVLSTMVAGSWFGTIAAILGVVHLGVFLTYIRADYKAKTTPPPLAPEPVDETEPDEPYDGGAALVQAWYSAMRVFFKNGAVAGGFSHSRLVEVGRTLSEGDWTELTRFYASDAGGRVLRLEPQGYVIGHGWTHDTILQAIVRETLPYPVGSPPEVVVLPDDTTRQDARRRPQTAKRAEVIDVA